MSYSSLVMVFRTTARFCNDFGNSWGTCPPLWEYLADKYLSKEESRYIMVMGDGVNKLYDILDSMTRQERAAMYLCADNVLIKREHIPMLVADLKELAPKIRAHTPEQNAFHWDKIPEEIEAMKLDKRALGIGLHATSVNGDGWCAYPKYMEIQSTSDGLYGDNKTNENASEFE